jgi:hypothetical protein
MEVSIPLNIIWGILGYIGISTAGFIWWAATTTANMQFMKDKLQYLVQQNALYATKVELAEKLSPINQSLERAWEKIDHLQEVRK